MQTSISTASGRLTGWPLSFLRDLNTVNQTVSNEVYGPTALGLLLTRLQALLTQYIAEGSLPASVAVNPYVPTDGTTLPDNTALFQVNGGATQPDFLITVTP